MTHELLEELAEFSDRDDYQEQLSCASDASASSFAGACSVLIPSGSSTESRVLVIQRELRL